MQVGEQIPRFEVTTVGGERVRYLDLWQRRHLVLVTVASSSPNDRSRGYVDQIAGYEKDFAGADAALVVTADEIPEAPPPSVVVADRWGEVAYVSGIAEDGRQVTLAPPAEILEWVHYLRRQCPECPP